MRSVLKQTSMSKEYINSVLINCTFLCSELFMDQYIWTLKNIYAYIYLHVYVCLHVSLLVVISLI